MEKPILYFILVLIPTLSLSQEVSNNSSGGGSNPMINNSEECRENSLKLIDQTEVFLDEVNKLKSKEVQKQKLNLNESLLLLNQYSVNYHLQHDTSNPSYQPDRECDCGSFKKSYVRKFKKILKDLREARAKEYRCTRGIYYEFKDSKQIIKNRARDDKDYIEANFYINTLIILYEQY